MFVYESHKPEAEEIDGYHFQQVINLIISKYSSKLVFIAEKNNKPRCNLDGKRG